MMGALADRRAWLEHLRFECATCPANPCDRGKELIAAVEQTMAHGESWQGVMGKRSDDEHR